MQTNQEKHMLTVAIETITPATAAAILMKNMHNRDVSAAVVNTYADAMTRGEWDEHSQIVIAEDGTLLDGQHRLLAVTKSGTTIRAVVVRGASMDMQLTVDDHRKRTLGDVLKIDGEKNARSLAAVVTFAYRVTHDSVRRQQSNVTKKQLTEFLSQHPQIRNHVFPIGFTEITRLGAQPAVVGALHYLFSLVDAEDADAFYTSLASGASLAAGSPILALRHRLESARASRITKARPVEVSAWFIKAWNAYELGVEMKQVKWAPGGAKPESYPSIAGLAEVLAAA